MAKQAAHGTRIYLDGYDLSGYLTATDLGVEQETPVVTCFGDAGPRAVVGNYGVAVSASGLFDGAAGRIDEIIDALRGNDSDHYLTQLFGGTVAGSISYDSIARMASEPRKADIGGAVMLDFSLAGSGGMARGMVLANKTSTGAENIAGVNQGVTTAGQVYAVTFRLLAFTGTSVTMKLQESQNDGAPDTYADIAGLTSGALSALGAVRVTTAAASEAWKRVVLSGTYSSALILVTAGVVAGT